MIPRPCRARWCGRCRRNVLTVKGRHRRDCAKCGCATRPRQPKALRRSKPLGAKRAAVKAAGTLTDEQWVEIGRYYNWMCAFCEIRRATQQDHFIPISKGGKHQADNILPVCEWCNSAKGCSTRWEPKRRHPFMEQARVLGRGKALAESFEETPFQIGGRE